MPTRVLSCLPVCCHAYPCVVMPTRVLSCLPVCCHALALQVEHSFENRTQHRFKTHCMQSDTKQKQDSGCSIPYSSQSHITQRQSWLRVWGVELPMNYCNCPEGTLFIVVLKLQCIHVQCNTICVQTIVCNYNYYPGQKKRTILEIRGKKNAVPRVISCSIRRNQRRAKVADGRGSNLPCADRAWSSMISHVEQRSSRCESRWWFFFLSRVVLHLVSEY